MGLSLVAVLVAIDSGSLGSRLIWALPAALTWPSLFSTYGLYERDSRRISQSTVDELPQLFHAVLIASLLLWIVLFLGPARPVGAAAIAAFGAVAFADVSLARVAARSFTARWLEPERVLIVGQGLVADTIVHKMRAHPECGLTPVALLDGTGTGGAGADELEALAVRHRIDRIVVAEALADPEPLLDLLAASRRLLLDVSFVPSIFEAMGPEVEVGDLEGMTVLSLNPPTLPRLSQAIKRGIDLVGAGAGLLIALPLLSVAALAIKLDSRGPVLFRQQRVGRRGRPFQIVKFRTMIDGAERLRAELQNASQDPNWLKLDHDPRITRIGSLLRRMSLDEMPQLWNVLIGEMSLVGPRPLPLVEDALIEGWRRGRLDLRPGITGYWQVLGRTNISLVEMVKLDYVYVNNWSLWTDVRLLLRTVPAVLRGRGAN